MQLYLRWLDVFAKHKESHQIDVIKEYDVLSTKFYDMLKMCKVYEDAHYSVDSQLASRDNSPAGAS